MSKEDFFSPAVGNKEDFNTSAPTYPSLTSAPAVAAPPSVYYTAPMAMPQPNSNSLTSCGKCARPISFGKGSVVVAMSCGHTMHASCFVKTINDQNLVDKCDSDFGGPQQCSRCFESIPVGFASAQINDRRKVLAEFRSTFTKQYGVNWSEGMREAPLTPEEVRTILGITLSMFTTDKTDYSQYGRNNNRSSEELVMELIQRGRTLDVIFAAKCDVMHLYRFGIQTIDQLQRLGYNAQRHCDAAHRSKCPYWLLSDLYGFSSENLLNDITPNELLKKPFKPSELWLCGVSMQTLVDRGLTKERLLAYSGGIVDMINYLDLTHAHLNKLEIKKSDWLPKWRDFAKSDVRVEALYKNTRA